MAALKPLLGPHGRRYDDGAVRLEVRNVTPEAEKMLADLGSRVPLVDKRESNPVNRGARHLVTAHTANGLKFKAAWAPRLIDGPTLPTYERGEAPVSRVDLRHVPKEEHDALVTLGSLVEPVNAKDTNAALRGLRYLIHAYEHGGLRLLGEWNP